MGGVGQYIKSLVEQLDPSTFCIPDREGASSFKDKIASRHIFTSITIRMKVLSYMFTFPYNLKKNKIDIVHANPSFSPIPLIRDGIFVLIASLLGVRILVFVHGWNTSYEKRLFKNRIMRLLFCFVYNKAEVIIVLAKKFKKRLREMGIKTKILVETTNVDDNVLKNFDITKKIYKKSTNDIISILFIARMVAVKGIFETIDAFHNLNTNYQNIELIIAGDGEDLFKAKQYVVTNNINNVKFLGYVERTEIAGVYSSADVYILPTRHGEGLPITLLEAMAFGLPVVTRPVGGIPDFFRNGKHGFITDSTSAQDFARLLEKLICDEGLRYRMGIYNHEYAVEHFLSSRVARRIEEIYKMLV